MVKYMPVEIWLSNWIVTTSLGTSTFKDEIIRKIPHFLLVNDPKFMHKVRLKFSDTQKYDTVFTKPVTVKIEYIKQLGIVNQIIEEDPWN